MRVLFLLSIMFCSNLVMGSDEKIVCVHGFMRKGGNMSAIARSFKKEGYEVVKWCYPSRQKMIEEHANDLVQNLKMLAGENPGKPIHFVTHSLGGLIVRCALNHSECPEEAKRGKAVLIAPPNRGSVLGRCLYRWGFVRRVLGDKAGEQLMTTELDGFDSLGNFPNQVSVLVIAGTMGLNPWIPGKNDGKVAVEETYLPTPHQHETVCAGHSWISACPSTIQRAKRFFKEN